MSTGRWICLSPSYWIAAAASSIALQLVSNGPEYPWVHFGSIMPPHGSRANLSHRSTPDRNTYQAHPGEPGTGKPEQYDDWPHLKYMGSQEGNTGHIYSTRMSIPRSLLRYRQSRSPQRRALLTPALALSDTPELAPGEFHFPPSEDVP